MYAVFASLGLIADGQSLTFTDVPLDVIRNGAYDAEALAYACGMFTGCYNVCLNINDVDCRYTLRGESISFLVNHSDITQECSQLEIPCESACNLIKYDVQCDYWAGKIDYDNCVDMMAIMEICTFEYLLPNDTLTCPDRITSSYWNEYCSNGEHSTCCTPTDECALFECEYSVCVWNSTTEPECICEDTRYGDHCQFPRGCERRLYEDASVCQHGDCINAPSMESGLRCECNTGWSGEYCNELIDYCEDVSCGNGTCQYSIDTELRTISIGCMCEPEWTGNSCETLIPCNRDEFRLGVECTPCHFSCSECDGSSGNSCTQCKDPHKIPIEGICLLICHSDCLACSTPYSTGCVVCREPNTKLTNGSCITECDPTCATCPNSSATACLTCAEDLIFGINGDCILACDDGLLSCMSALTSTDFIGLYVLLACYSGVLLLFGIARYHTPLADNVAIVSLCLAYVDVITDVAFAANLNAGSLRIASIMFIAIPSAGNIAMVGFIIMKSMHVKEFRTWITKHHFIAGMACAGSPFSVDVLRIITSGVFGLTILKAGLTERTLIHVKFIGLIALVMEDIPQLTIQCLLLGQGQINVMMLAAIIGSLVNCVFGILSRVMLIIVVCKQDRIAEYPPQLSSLSDDEQKRVSRTTASRVARDRIKSSKPNGSNASQLINPITGMTMHTLIPSGSVTQESSPHISPVDSPISSPMTSPVGSYI